MYSSVRKKNLISALWDTAIDTLLPPRCLATGDIVDHPGMLTPAAWAELRFIENPFCQTCGIPFSFEMTGHMLCAACIEREPFFDHSRSAVVYNDAVRKLVLAFKYGDRLHAVDTFTPWLLRAGQELLERAHFILPVPLHRQRLRERRFNQSALLAQRIAQKTTIPYLANALLRLRHTPPQQGLNARERDRNVRGAFAVSEHCLENLKTKNILLIDDVFTSGATLNECARVLKAAKTAEVNVLTIARVTREE